MSYKQVSPVPVDEGGTNARSFANDHGVAVYEGGKLITLSTGLAGHVLTSNGIALPPSFQAAGSGNITTLDGDSGSATGSTVTLAGGSNTTTSATGSTVTFDLDNTVSISGSFTAGTGITTDLGGIHVTGSSNINTAALDFSTTIGNTSGSSALTLISGSGGTSITNNNSALTVATGTGAIDLGTDAAAKAITIGNTTGATAITIDTGSGGITVPSFITTGAVVVDAAGVVTDADASTSGFVLTSTGAGTTPTFQAIPPSFTWNNVTGASQAMAVGNGYVDNGSASPTPYTLPATGAVGDLVSVQGASAGLFKIAQNALQQIHFNGVSSTIGVGGSVTATGQYDSISLICITANTDWAVNTSVGTFNVV